MILRSIKWLAVAGVALGLAGCEVDVDDERDDVPDVEFREEEGGDGHLHERETDTDTEIETERKIERDTDIQLKEQEPTDAPRTKGSD